jgi:hypothetical protein
MAAVVAQFRCKGMQGTYLCHEVKRKNSFSLEYPKGIKEKVRMKGMNKAYLYF